MLLTYYTTPPTKNKYKLFVILSFNKNRFCNLLCNLSLIENENKQTFISVLNFLKNKYNFNPHKISIDFNKAEYAAIKYRYKDVIIIPCFFHFIHNIIKKIPTIRSKNKKEKKLVRDLLANIKL